MMRKPLSLTVAVQLSVVALLLHGCGTGSATTRARADPAPAERIECEQPGTDQCVVLACDGEQGQCGVFSCDDVDPDAIVRASLAHGAELARGSGVRPSMRGPGPSRNWRNTGLRDGARPRMTVHFRYREGFLPAFPRLDGKLIKHHLFPQAPDLAAWFRVQGINVHDWTMVIPERVHWRIHSGAPRGGLWNQAWREFRDANPTRRFTKEELLAKAFELSYRFDVVGPIIPYGHSLVSPGPQLFAP